MNLESMNPSALFLASACIAIALPTHAQERGGQGLRGGGGPPLHEDGLTAPEDWAAARALARHELGGAAFLRTGPPDKFTFYPTGGTLYGDLFTVNFVDLDPSPGFLDWDCTGYAYDGHDASDVLLRSFGEQAIGVPVFAALDGIVVASHDGEEDEHVVCSGLANSVIIDHGNGRVCRYWHLKRDSVSVVPGQVVRAGQQIGLVGSSGCSDWPHLHFATYDSGNLVEPYAGPCRPGASEWVDQTPIEHQTYVADLNVTGVDIGAYPGLPFDLPRRGTFVQGFRNVRFWSILTSLPDSSTWRVLVFRPNGSIAIDHASSFPSSVWRWSWWWWSYGLSLNQVGEWQIALEINGAELARVPFDVVATGAEVVNRPPHPVAVHLEPRQPTASDVLLCRVETDLVLDDPDYDLVRYRYVWAVDGVVARDVTTAAHSDAFPRLTAAPGSLVTCTVTPSDGTASAGAVMDAVNIRWNRGARPAAVPLGSASVRAP